MNREKFIELEFVSLRKEVEDARGRLFQLTVGSSIVPVALLAGIRGDLSFITLFLPLFVFVIALAFIYQQACIMRCGHYIKNEIEPLIELDFKGWEKWLEKEINGYDPRSAEKYKIYSFRVVTAIYYICSSCIAFRYALKLYEGDNSIFNQVLLSLSACSYLVFGIILIVTVGKIPYHSENTSDKKIGKIGCSQHSQRSPDGAELAERNPGFSLAPPPEV